MIGKVVITSAPMTADVVREQCAVRRGDSLCAYVMRGEGECVTCDAETNHRERGNRYCTPELAGMQAKRTELLEKAQTLLAQIKTLEDEQATGRPTADESFERNKRICALDNELHETGRERERIRVAINEAVKAEVARQRAGMASKGGDN